MFSAVKPVSVFEERVSVFKEESTPVQFSTATSLSDLTFDDEPPVSTSFQSVYSSMLGTEAMKETVIEGVGRQRLFLYQDFKTRW